MHIPPSSSRDLAAVVDLMRELSRQKNPQAAARLYGDGLRKLNLIPSDRYLSLSRRGLERPWFRITRNSSWKTQPDPWNEPEKLPLLSGGILSDILYSNEPAIVQDLDTAVSKDDPAYDYLHDMKILVSLPHYDDGESINAGVVLAKDPSKISLDAVPMMVWQANLWGRATLNLVTHQKLEKAWQALDRELKVVADIQRSLLPRKLPAIPGVQLAAYYQTSQRAGGDYYDFFPLPDNRWGILLADVSGHGTPAAVLMAVTHAIAHSHPNHPTPPEDVLAFVNKKLASLYTVDNGNFVTAFYAVYDASTRAIQYASAGHPAPRLVRGGTVAGLDGETSLPLGVDGRERFLQHQTTLQPGDRLVLYTDGITEAFNPAGELFGTQRLDDACTAAGNSSAEEMLQRLLTALGTFSQQATATDDRTVLTMALA